ncbi:MAG: cobalt transporter CbiM [Pseudomonadota bacterium]
MHISEGILSGPVLISGAVFAVAGISVGLKQLDFDKIPQAAVLSAAFFVASLIHVPIGVSSAHLILNGILGLILGWTAFPAIAVALVLQAMLFQFGGVTTLGINTTIMVVPAVFCRLLFGHFVTKNGITGIFAAFACGFLPVLLSGLIVSLSLFLSEKNFFQAAAAVLGAHIVIMIMEGIITVLCVQFLKKVRPGMLPGAGR